MSARTAAVSRTELRTFGDPWSQNDTLHVFREVDPEVPS
jgi:hypothetical protein